jgi:hypothetical protein
MQGKVLQCYFQRFRARGSSLGCKARSILLRKLWVAVFISFCFFRMAVTPFWAPENRFFFHWQRSDALAIGGLIIFLGLLILVSYEFTRRLGWIGRLIGDFAYLLIGAFYLRVALLESVFSSGIIPQYWSVASKLLHMSLLLFFVIEPGRAVRFLERLCLMLSPIIMIFMFNIALARPIMPTAGGICSSTGGAEKPQVTKILFIILDGTSYNRIFHEREVLKQYPNIERLASTSVVFHRASSPAGATFQSVTQILCSQTGRVVIVEGRACIRAADRQIAVSDTDHIFKSLKRLGYRTTWHGLYLPCGQYFPDSLDDGFAKSFYKPLGSSPFEVATSLLVLHLGKRVPPPVSFFRKAYARMEVSGMAEYDEWIHRQALAQIRDPRTGFSFLHYRTPHAPFIHDADGHVSDMSRVREPNLEAYCGALRWVDRRIGELLDALTDQPWAGSTLLVVTADHGFRNDPERHVRDWDVLHVPLLVRLPGQSERLDIEKPVALVDLKPVLVDCVTEVLKAEAFAQKLTERREAR